MLTVDQLSVIYSGLEPFPPTMAVDGPSPLQFQSLTKICLSDEERISQTITNENAAVAITALHRDGIVCLSNAIDPTHVEVLHRKLEAEVPRLRVRPETYWNNAS
jgi:hypothetical protein